MNPQLTFIARLRRERLRSGVSLTEIASKSRVKLELLEAFENNDLTDWPRGLYHARGCVPMQSPSAWIRPTRLTSSAVCICTAIVVPARPSARSPKLRRTTRSITTSLRTKSAAAGRSRLLRRRRPGSPHWCRSGAPFEGGCPRSDRLSTSSPGGRRARAEFHQSRRRARPAGFKACHEGSGSWVVGWLGSWPLLRLHSVPQPTQPPNPGRNRRHAASNQR